MPRLHSDIPTSSAWPPVILCATFTPTAILTGVAISTNVYSFSAHRTRIIVSSRYCIMGRVYTLPRPPVMKSGPLPSELDHSNPGHPQSHEPTFCFRPFLVTFHAPVPPYFSLRTGATTQRFSRILRPATPSRPRGSPGAPSRPFLLRYFAPLSFPEQSSSLEMHPCPGSPQSFRPRFLLRAVAPRTRMASGQLPFLAISTPVRQPKYPAPSLLPN